MKRTVFFILTLSVFSTLFGQVPPDYRYLKMIRISERFADVDSIPADSAHLNFQNNNPIDRFSISNSWNGNLGSPLQSRLYFDRPENTDFIFANAYYPYMIDAAHAVFMNTKKPFSNLYYTNGGQSFRKENNIKFLFSANNTKRFNAGVLMDYFYNVGSYTNQAARKFSGALFGHYDGDHYKAKAYFSFNKMKNQENGGLSDATELHSGIATEDMGVNLSTAQSSYTQNQLYYNHQYSIGIERPTRISADSVRMDYVPVTIFAHTFNYLDQRKKYFENSVNTAFYDNTYGVLSYTNDTTSLQTLTNNFSISMAEEFNKWLDFGLRAFVENEVQRYVYTKDNMLNLDFKSSTKIGGVLSKQRGRTFRYNVLGELGFLGYKAGTFNLGGNIGGFFKLWNDSIALIADGFVRSDKPSLFLQYYESNHFRWNNDFNNVYRTHIGGTFSIPTRSLSLKVGVENITQYIYFDSLALPKQYSGNIQVMAFNLKKDFHLGKFHLENNVVYQVSSKQDILPLPALTLYHNLYFDDYWFQVLSIQMGVDVRYFTAYNAPLYMPATGQYIAEQTTKVGNFPVSNAYLNLHLKRTRFFVEYYHVNNLFMKTNYFSMAGYPINPAMVKIGLSWNFYD
ncbi:MAG: hypothetical protein RIS29_141 [Bacteroidota bacterium]